MNVEVGQKYRVLQELGQGGAAKVYLAVVRGPQGFSKLVVLKVPKPSQDEHLGANGSFLNEARLAARLNHPNIVETYEVFEYRDVPIIIMQYLEGQSLSAIVARERDRFSVSMYLHVFCDTLAGLHHSHELRGYDGKPLNVVHRDVSPQNIFITYDGQVKVLDFGIAKLVGNPDETATGIIKGKLSYMAPEQVLCAGMDRRTDIFSVGVMLWEAAAGERMHKGVPEAGILQKLVNGDFRPPHEVRPVDPELERIIMKALAPNMDDRYATATEMQADLEALITTPRSQLQRKLSAMVSEIFQDEREARAATISHALSKAAPVTGGGEQIDFSEVGPSSPGLDGESLTLDTVSGMGPAPGRGNTGTGAVVTNTGAQLGGLGKRWWVGAAAALSLALVAGVFAARVIQVGSSSNSVQGTAPALSAEAKSRKLRLVTTPDGARVFFDGKLLGTTPFIGERPWDRAEHQLRLELEGYQRSEQSIRLESDLDLRLSLVPIHSPTPAGSASGEPSGVTAGRNSGAGDGVGNEPRGGGGRRPPVTATPTPQKKPPAAVPAAGGDKACSPPYYFDENGLRHFKPQCI